MIETVEAGAMQRRVKAEAEERRSADLVAILRDQMQDAPLGSAERRELRARLHMAEEELDDAREEIARLGPAVEAQRAAQEHERAKERHAAALASVNDPLTSQATKLDAAFAFIVDTVGVVTRNADRAAALAGLKAQPVQAEWLVDILLGKLCAAGLLDFDAYPSRYANDFRMEVRGDGVLVHNPVNPATAAKADSVARAVRDLHDMIAGNPPRSPAALAREAAEREARRAAEAERLAQPMPPQQPSPAPIEFRAGR